MSLRSNFLESAMAMLSALRASRKARALSGSAVGLSLIAFGAAGVAPIAPDASHLPVTRVIEELALPSLDAQIAALSPSARFIAEERVRPGDNLSALLERLGVNDAPAANFIRGDAAAKALLALRPGRRIQATMDADGRLLSASALLADGRNDPMKLLIERGAAGFSAKHLPVTLDRQIEMRSGEIRSSLFAATDSAQIPDAVATQLVDIFSSDIDFASDLRKGDRFRVVYESDWQDGELLRSGRVIAAEFINNGTMHQAIWYAHAGGDGGYYDAQGQALKKAFLKSPLPFSRVTSGFAMRVHPVSGQWKQHKGIDFGAPVGTPIRATGDGVIEFAGAGNGYGNLVVVRHGPVYSTAYAHMSRITARRGMRVSQGDVIGFVGTTGWSTGPHLHYEFRVNNDARDPDSVVVPQVQALTGTDLQQYRRVAADMGHRFALLAGTPTLLASR
jgi:murein DD-endopeptidase MepM/ murein hydrolase activator NlpD